MARREGDLADDPATGFELAGLGLEALAGDDVRVEVRVREQQLVGDDKRAGLAGPHALDAEHQLDPVATGRVLRSVAVRTIPRIRMAASGMTPSTGRFDGPNSGERLAATLDTSDTPPRME